MASAELVGYGHPKRWIVSVSIFLVTAFFFYVAFVHGRVETWQDALSQVGWTISILAAAGAMFIVLLVFFVAAIPPRMDTDLRETIDRLRLETQTPERAAILAETNELKRANNRLAQRNSVLGRQIETLTQQLDRTKTDYSALQDRVNRRAERLAELRTAIENHISRLPNCESHDEVSQWMMDGRELVKQSGTIRGARVRLPRIRPRLEPDTYRRFVDQAIEALREFSGSVTAEEFPARC